MSSECVESFLEKRRQRYFSTIHNQW